MKKINIYLSILLFTVLAACSKKQEISLEQSFELRYKSIATIGKELEIKFYEVSDSRCPDDVDCVIPGDLDIGLKINGETFELVYNESRHDKVEKDGFEIELANALPVSYTSTERPRKSEYSITLIVRKK